MELIIGHFLTCFIYRTQHFMFNFGALNEASAALLLIPHAEQSLSRTVSCKKQLCSMTSGTGILKDYWIFNNGVDSLNNRVTPLL